MPTSAVENCSEWSPNNVLYKRSRELGPCGGGGNDCHIVLQCNRPIIRRHGIVATGGAKVRILGTAWAWSAEGRNFGRVDREVRLAWWVVAGRAALPQGGSGEAPLPLEQMLRPYLLQYCFDLSDRRWRRSTPGAAGWAFVSQYEALVQI